MITLTVTFTVVGWLRLCISLTQIENNCDDAKKSKAGERPDMFIQSLKAALYSRSESTW